MIKIAQRDKLGKKIKIKKAIEKLVHFNCPLCGKWWTVGDAPGQKKTWFCPWCGAKLTD